MLGLALCLAACSPAQVVILRYAHMNDPASVAGRQAELFARKVKEYSKGRVTIELHPSSQLGSLERQLSDVRSGEIDIHHTTAAGLGSICGDFAILDTPYLYSDVDHLLRVTAPDSPVMRELAEKLLKEEGLRLLYTFYFGSRELTCNRPVHGPGDLAGVRIRSIPFPLYELAVEALGGQPVPLDWAQTPLALLTHSVDGQENPLDVILTSRLYESQSHLMLTGHILGAEMVVMSDRSWKRLSGSDRAALLEAAREAGEWATRATREGEAAELEELKGQGMSVIGAAEGLDMAAFRERARRLVDERYGKTWGEYYNAIEAMR
jgi:tripartite ATP-independent transporter DctP family solute receptor